MAYLSRWSSCSWLINLILKLFYTKEKALEYRDQFEKCCDLKLLDYLVKGTEEIL